MFPKRNKLIIALTLISYGSMTIPMEQPNPSWWQQAKTWWFHQPDQTKAERKRKNRLRKEIARHLLFNASYVVSGLSDLYQCYCSNTSHFPTIATMQDGLPKEQISLIKDVLLPMGVPADTKVALTPADSSLSAAAAGHKFLVIRPALFNLYNQSEQTGLLAHEGSHIINNDVVNQSLFKICLPVLSWGILKGYDVASTQLLEYAKDKCPCIKNHLENIQKVNDYFARSWFTHVFLGHILWVAFARSCESRADYDSAQAVGPHGLISFLKKCSDPEICLKMRQVPIQEPPIEFLDILKVVPNLLELASNQLGILQVHPSNANRIKALEALQSNNKE